jgi:hypothetical protein
MESLTFRGVAAIMGLMKRDIYSHLQKWKSSDRRKPLILNGARQVGKTHSLKTFGASSYEKVAYLNFEKNEKLGGFFHNTLEPRQLLKTLEIHLEMEIAPHNTLLIFDEIQECPRALNSLKYFCEEANEYQIAAAGSLLGVETANEKGFPVGKVNFLHLFPLSFLEFLSAMGQDRLRAFLQELQTYEPIPAPLHDKAIDLLKLYLFIGGMPEAVASYARDEKLDKVREIQLEILSAYEKDFAKHAPTSEIMKITTVWKQVHRQLAKENKKFIFSAIRGSARGRDYEEAIQWLVDAGLIYKSHLAETPKFPLSAYADSNAFKLFLLDIGLLGAQSNLSSHAVIEGDQLFTEFKGSLMENFVAQELKAVKQRELYYWTSERAAEVDFLIESDHSIYPLEAKAGVSTKKKSLLVYGEKHPTARLSRATLMNLKHDGDIYNYPLYLVSRFPLENSL